MANTPEQTREDNSGESFATSLSSVMERLSPEAGDHLLRQLQNITDDAKAIETDLEDQDSAKSTYQRLLQIRRDVRKAIVASCWRRTLEVMKIPLDRRLNIINETQKIEALRKTLEDNRATMARIVARSNEISGTATPSEPIATVEEKKKASVDPFIAATIVLERDLQRARRQSLSPFSLAMELVKLESSWWALSAFRFVSVLAFGMIIFLVAGKVHERTLSHETWYVAAILVSLGVAFIEFFVHRLGERFFERQAHKDRAKLNDWLLRTRMNYVMDEVMAERARES